MENPFKQIIEDKKLPETIKGKVVNNINLIKLSIEISELFLVSIPDVMLKLLGTDKTNTPNEDTISKKNNPNKNK